ncbi:MAG: hypothetical protein ACHQM6_10970, partial [Candidatus Kapaibacterium sp.]
MKILSRYSVAALFFTIFIGGCKYNPGPSPGSITVVRPALNDTIVGGTKNYQITWAGSNINSQKSFDYSLDNGTTWKTIGSMTSDAFLYDWNVPDTFATQAIVRITDKNNVVGKSGVFVLKSSGPGKTIPAKPGSTFIFKNDQTDTSGRVIDSTVYYSKDSIAETGVFYAGKTNVTHIISVDPVTGLAYYDSYINFETNGDISVYVGSNGGFGGVTLPPWRTYPIQSHVTLGAKVGDTTITFPGIPLPIPIKVYDSLFYVNNSIFSVGTINIPVFNSLEVVTINATVIIAPITSRTLRLISFAPSLG